MDIVEFVVNPIVSVVMENGILGMRAVKEIVFCGSLYVIGYVLDYSLVLLSDVLTDALASLCI